MQNNKLYFAIGLFLIVGFVIFTIACAIFGKGQLFRQKIYFETCFDTSVNGLDIGGPVKFRGIPLGEIEAINFADAIYREKLSETELSDPTTVKKLMYVRVLCSIDVTSHPDFSEARLVELTQQNNLHTKLQSAGITGGAFIALDIEEKQHKVANLLNVSWRTEEHYIPSAHSTLQNAMDTLDNLAQQLDNVQIDELTVMLGELMKTVKAAVEESKLPDLSKQVSNLTKKVQDFVDAINKKDLGGNLANIAENLAEISDNVKEALPTVTESTTSTLASANKTLEAMGDTLEAITAAIQDFQESVDTGVIGADIEDALNTVSRTTAALEALVNELRVKPSRIIFDDPLE